MYVEYESLRERQKHYYSSLLSDCVDDTPQQPKTMVLITIAKDRGDTKTCYYLLSLASRLPTVYRRRNVATTL